MRNTNPTLTTMLWSDPIVNNPEDKLLGTMFTTAMGFGEAWPWVVTKADHWIYANTGLKNGDSIANLVGYEFDKAWADGNAPSGTVLLSNSPVGAPYNSVQNASLYTAPSGAIVFNGATNYWPYYLVGNWIWPFDARIQQMTINLIQRMTGSSPTLTPTATATANGPTSTATNTNTPTKTATATPTVAAGSGTFYRAINVAGTAQVIDGNNWEADGAPNFTTTGTAQICNTWTTLAPSTDAARQAMVQCYGYGWNQSFTMSNIPNGSYRVYLYVFEDWQSRSYNISVQGTQVTTYATGSAGAWAKIGPWNAAVTNGTLTVATCCNTSEVSGFEVWTNDTSTPTSVPSNTPTATNMATNTATNTATATATTVLPAYKPLTACWVNHVNGTGGTVWNITNPNPVPLSRNPDTRVRYNWYVYNALNAQGTILQSATALELVNPNPVNAAYSQNIKVEWYLFIGGNSTGILGSAVANANTAGPCAVQTPTATATKTRTTTATATRTPTATITPTPVIVQASTLYRAVNLNGTAQTIDGHAWAGDLTSNFIASSLSQNCNNSITLVPSTDVARAAMIRCYRSSAAPLYIFTAVPNGTYQVYVYTFEFSTSRTYSIQVQGTTVQSNYTSGAPGTWRKLGPYTANVTGGMITVATSGQTSQISGIELWCVTSATATPKPTNTAAAAPTFAP